MKLEICIILDTFEGDIKFFCTSFLFSDPIQDKKSREIDCQVDYYDDSDIYVMVDSTIIIIIVTRPKPAYGRRGLAGSGAKIQMK